MPKLNTESVLKGFARDIINEWLREKGYQVMRYDADDAEFTVVQLGVMITALNYSPKHRKKFAKKYHSAKKLYREVHSSLREWEIENCQKTPFENFPSEILRREVQEKIDEEFRAGFRDIEKYLENIDMKLSFTIGQNLKKKKKKRK